MGKSVGTVLVMGDGECAGDSIRGALGSAGYDIVQAADCAAALASAKSGRPDLIIVDICMPRHPGLYILRDLKNDPATHDIPVIILTSMGKRLGVSFSTEELCCFLGIEPNAFLETPVQPDRLLEMTERLMGRSQKESQRTL